MVTYVHVRSELDEETLPLEAQLPHLGPVKSIDLREALRKESNPVSQQVGEPRVSQSEEQPLMEDSQAPCSLDTAISHQL